MASRASCASPDREVCPQAGGWDGSNVADIESRAEPGSNGMAEGVSPKLSGRTVSKLLPDGLLIVRAGGGAGKFSGIIAGWTPGTPESSRPVTKEVKL